MSKKYVSTRGHQEPLNFYQSILQGIGSDGGLLVPDFDFEKKDLNKLVNLSYIDLATEIISSFVDEEGYDDIHRCCENAYGTGLFVEGIVPVEKAGDVYIAELFHGQTAAFKDMALSILPHFITLSLKKMKEDREVMILTATSGDTGKAALEGFKDVEGTSIKVFYPDEGVSPIQKQQMVSQTGNNVEVIGIVGNFDDAQSAVKKAFNSEKLKELCDEHHVFLSSANSINIGRLIPQVVYYFYSYFNLVSNKVIELGDEVNFTIPSGNFGNALAGYIAYNMGLPIKTFVCASNKNNILTDFFNSGKYDANREFYKTNAPAMDILVSSNLERLVYLFTDGNGELVEEYMNKLNTTGVYEVEEDVFNKISSKFKAGWINEDEVIETIGECYKENDYLLDTHTAVGYGVYKRYRQASGDSTPTIILSTASPYKFPESVYKAITGKTLGEYEAIDAVNEETGVPIPEPLVGIKDREVLHKLVIDKEDIVDFIGERVKGK